MPLIDPPADPVILAIRTLRMQIDGIGNLTGYQKEQIRDRFDRIEQIIAVTLDDCEHARERLRNLLDLLGQTRRPGDVVDSILGLLRDDGTHALGCEPACVGGACGGCGERDRKAIEAILE